MSIVFPRHQDDVFRPQTKDINCHRRAKKADNIHIKKLKSVNFVSLFFMKTTEIIINWTEILHMKMICKSVEI